MKLVAYIRVSTQGQVDDGLGLDVQREQIRKWTRARGDRVVEWFSDEGVSGTKDAPDREGLASALQTICDREADGLVVAKLDRLARSLTVQEAALAHVWRCNGTVYTVDQGLIAQDDPDDPMRTAMRLMVGVFGQLERAMIAKRLRDGRRLKAERGGHAQGAPPYGYRAEGGELVPDPTEQAAIERAFELRSTHSLRQIAAVLTEEGHRPRRSDTWHIETVRQILERERTTGTK